MEKLLVAMLLVVACAGMPRGSFDGRAEWAINSGGAGVRFGAVIRVERRDSGNWDLRVRGRVPGVSEWWRVCMTQDWRPCRA